jgi:hypothetical protein
MGEKEFEQLIKILEKMSWTQVIYICNPGYFGG